MHPVYPHKWLNFKSLFITTSLCFISISSHGEGWYPLQKDEGRASFVQIIAPSQDNAYPKAWWWIIWRDKQEGWDNGKYLYELDCKNHRTRRLHRSIYDGEELIASYPIKEDWKSALPVSNGDQFIKLVCDQSEGSLRFKPIEVNITAELSSLRDKRGQQAFKESLAKRKWFLAYAMDDKYIAFFDKNSLRIKGSYRQILSWNLVTNPLSEQPLVIIANAGMLAEFDCAKQRIRFLKMFNFNKNRQIISQTFATEWKPVETKLGYVAFSMVCQNHFKGTPITVDFSTIKTIPEEWLVGSDE